MKSAYQFVNPIWKVRIRLSIQFSSDPGSHTALVFFGRKSPPKKSRFWFGTHTFSSQPCGNLATVEHFVKIASFFGGKIPLKKPDGGPGYNHFYRNHSKIWQLLTIFWEAVSFFLIWDVRSNLGSNATWNFFGQKCLQKSPTSVRGAPIFTVSLDAIEAWKFEYMRNETLAQICWKNEQTDRTHNKTHGCDNAATDLGSISPGAHFWANITKKCSILVRDTPKKDTPNEDNISLKYHSSKKRLFEDF